MFYHEDGYGGSWWDETPENDEQEQYGDYLDAMQAAIEDEEIEKANDDNASNDYDEHIRDMDDPAPGWFAPGEPRKF